MSELHDLIATFAAIGATEDGGVCRLAASPLDRAARDLFLREIGNRQLVPRIDPIGNMFGVALRDALARIGYRGASELEFRPVRYVELHVEQGDRLERAAADIAAVSGAWMTRKMSVVFEGEVSHTGPTPMSGRRDALRAAARAIEALYGEVERENAGAHAAA